MICSVRHPVLRCLTLALFSSWLGTAGAVGLGAIRLQSSLGQPLNAEIPLIGSDTAELTSSCFRTRLQTADGAALGNAIVAVSRLARGEVVLLSTRQAINEPAILVDVTVTCGTLVHREFSILLDPIGMLPTVADVSGNIKPDGAPLATRRERRAAARNANRSSAEDRAGTDGIGSQPNYASPGAGASDKPAKSPSQKLTVSPKLAVPRKSVLKLSNEGFTDAELASMGHLKLSDSMADTLQPVDAAQRDDLMAARLRFAQVLRGDNPERIAAAEIAADVRQITALRSQLSVATRQRASDQAAIDELKKTSLPMKWVFAIALLLLASLLVAGWLAWRLKSVKKQAASAWDLALASPAQSESPDVSVATAPVTPSAMTKTVSTDFGHHPASTPVPANTKDRLSPVLKEPYLPQSDRTERLAARPDPVAPVTEPLAAAAVPVVASTASNSADHVDAMPFYSSKVEHLKVEEISDVMQEAEFWMSLNDPQRAIEILEPYAAIDLPDSPIPWLYLLDLYRGTDQRLKYTALHDKASRVFNARIPLWDEDGDLSDGRTLEDFPHVVERICALWETNEIFDYLESLIFDRREGIREGFDLFVYQEIMLLLTMVRSYGRERPAIPFSGSGKLTLAIDS